MVKTFGGKKGEGMDLTNSVYRLGKKGGESAKNYKNKWRLSFRWVDDSGRRRQKDYSFRTEQDAKDARPKLETELIKTHGRKTVGDRMTFTDLATYARQNFYRPAEIVNGRKIAGVKSYQQTHVLLNSLIEYFGKKRLSQITRNDMEGFKSWRYKQGSRRGNQGKLKPKDRKPVTASTVNRELSIFIRLMKHAHAEGWISRDITLGSKAIDRDAEKVRERTLSESEESRLLAVCGGRRMVTYKRRGKTVTASTNAENTYLRAAILLGLDAGLRKKEILTLEWDDVDFKGERLEVQSHHTKTQRGRTVPLMKRILAELRALPNYGGSGRIFPFGDFKRSWATALRLAEIEGLTFHDLRSTFITRAIRRGVPLAVVSKLAGHSSIATTQKHYVSILDPEVIEEARAKMEPMQIPDIGPSFIN